MELKPYLIRPDRREDMAPENAKVATLRDSSRSVLKHQHL